MNTREQEIERISQRTDIDEQEKRYLIRLISMNQTESREHSKKREALMRSLSYTITLTGEELLKIRQAAQLNRRMLDRSPEHTFLNEAFKVIEEKCAEIFKVEWRKKESRRDDVP